MRRSWCFVVAGVAAGLLAGWEMRGAEIATSKDLLAADKAFARASGEKGLEAWLAVMAPDVRVFPGDAIVEGFDKVKALYERTRFDPRPLRWVPVGAEVSASGDMGYTYGTWERDGKAATGEAMRLTGKYVTVWTRAKGGPWRMQADIGSVDPPKTPCN
ncbi:MAG: nuclear transport factor 2 family protein [Thermoanaerobaculaceae bacterium]|jgi:ketosteroid isomerase-like protein